MGGQSKKRQRRLILILSLGLKEGGAIAVRTMKKLKLSNYYKLSGGDTTKCEFCGKKINNKEPWKMGLDGAKAHLKCIPKWN